MIETPTPPPASRDDAVLCRALDARDASLAAAITELERLRSILLASNAELDAARAEIVMLRQRLEISDWIGSIDSPTIPIPLNKDPESWARVSPTAVCTGSQAQIYNVLSMALADIGRLSAELARLRSAAPSGDLRVENEKLRAALEDAIQFEWEARSNAHYGAMIARQQKWSDALASPQPDAGARGEGLDPYMMIGSKPATPPSPEAAPPETAMEMSRRVLGNWITNRNRIMGDDAAAPNADDVAQARPYQGEARRIAAELIGSWEDETDRDFDHLELKFSHSLEAAHRAGERAGREQMREEAAQEAKTHTHAHTASLTIAAAIRALALDPKEPSR